jgi:hypothetical protein
MRKGFIEIAAMLALAAVSIGFMVYALHLVQDSTDQKLAANIIDTQISDSIGTFRTNVNTSLDNLNTQLNSVSSSVSGLGTMSAVNSPCAVANGCLGTSTAPTANQIPIASGTTPTWKTLTASSGISITFDSTHIFVSSQGIDTTQAFTWTGAHTFSATTTFASTTKFTGVASFGVLLGGGSATTTSVAANATNTTLYYNGSSWVAGGTVPIKTYVAGGNVGVSANTTTTIASATLPQATTTTVYHVVAFINADSGTGANASATLTLNNTAVCGFGFSPTAVFGATNAFFQVSADFTLMGSTNSQLVDARCYSSGATSSISAMTQLQGFNLSTTTVFGLTVRDANTNTYNGSIVGLTH